MNNETRLNEIQQEILKKFRNQQSWNIRLEQRLLGYQVKMNLLRQEKTSYNYGKQSFQELLSKSVILKDYLKKVQQNSIQNLKIIQDHINRNLEGVHRKCNLIEQKMLNLLWQKEKAFENATFQIENNTISIKSFEEYLKISRNQTQTLNIYEENIKMRHNSLLKQVDLRIDNIKDELAIIQVKQEKIQRKNQILEQQIIKANQKIQEKHNVVNSIKEELQNIKEKHHTKLEIRDNTNQKQNQIKQTDLDIQKIYKEIRNIQQKLSILQSQFESFKMNLRSSESEIPMTNIKNNNQTLLSKPLSRQPLYQNHQQKSEEIGAMRGGIHGLLRRSKQKEQQKSPLKYNTALKYNTPSLLNPLKPPPKKNNLPPMKSNPILNRQQKRQIYEQQQQQQQDSEEEVYECDEEGYLMDCQGNYLQDQEGERIKISEEQLNQLANQNSKY